MNHTVLIVLCKKQKKQPMRACLCQSVFVCICVCVCVSQCHPRVADINKVHCANLLWQLVSVLHFSRELLASGLLGGIYKQTWLSLGARSICFSIFIGLNEEACNSSIHEIRKRNSKQPKRARSAE